MLAYTCYYKYWCLYVCAFRVASVCLSMWDDQVDREGRIN